jgi:hypothetical protein
VQDRCTVYAKLAKAQKSFWKHLMVLLGDEALKWKLVLVRLGIVPIFKQNRCIVCTKHTIGSDIILDAPNGTPR